VLPLSQTTSPVVYCRPRVPALLASVSNHQDGPHCEGQQPQHEYPHLYHQVQPPPPTPAVVLQSIQLQNAPHRQQIPNLKRQIQLTDQSKRRTEQLIKAVSVCTYHSGRHVSSERSDYAQVTHENPQHQCGEYEPENTHELV